MTELIKTYEDYIRLLGDEINDLIGIAYIHGWESKNVDKGRELRDKIAKLKKQYLKEDPNY